jgi:hypothetical protein
MVYPLRLFDQFITTKAYVEPTTTGKSALNAGPFKFPGPLVEPLPPFVEEIPVGPFVPTKP